MRMNNNNLLTKTIALLLIFGFVFMVMLAGCASLAGKDDSPQLKEKKTYMTARKEFALTIEKYNVYYAGADSEIQAEWKVNIDPLFMQVNKALSAWKMAIDNNWDPTGSEAQFLRLKSELLIYLVDVFGVKEE